MRIKDVENGLILRMLVRGLVVAGICGSALGQLTPVNIPLKELTGSDFTRTIILTPLDGQYSYNGVIYTGGELRIRPVANGATNLLGVPTTGIITNLAGGNWRLSFEGLTTASGFYAPFGETNGISVANPLYKRTGLYQVYVYSLTNLVVTNLYFIDHGTNISFTTNGQRVTISAQTDTNVVNALAGAIVGSGFLRTNDSLGTNITLQFTDPRGNPWTFNGQKFLSLSYSPILSAMNFNSDAATNPIVTVNGSLHAVMSSTNAVPLVVSAGVAGTNLLEAYLGSSMVAWMDSSGVLHNPGLTLGTAGSTIVESQTGGTVFADTNAPTKKAKISGGVYTGDGGGLSNLLTSSLVGTVSFSTLAGTITNIPLANAITNGGIGTNQFATLLLPPERRTSGLKHGTVIIDTWNLYGPNTTEAQYWAVANNWYTNGFYKTWPEAGFTITEGWQGGRDGNGNIYESAAKFPHGLAFTVNVLKTNGFKWVAFYTEARTNTTANPTLNVGSMNYIQQDASNYVRFGGNAVRMDNPPSYAVGDTTWNLRTAYYCQQMRYWMDNYAGYPTWITSSGWNPTNDLKTLGAVDAWYIVGLLGDANVTPGEPALLSYWTNYLPHLYFSSLYKAHGGKGALQTIEAAQVGLNPAYWKLNVMSHGLLYIPQPYAYNINSPAAYGCLTNVLLKQILEDELFAFPTQVISNGTAEVWYEPLMGGDKAVMLMNTSTNSTVNVGFDARDVGLNYGGQYKLTEQEYATNTYMTGTFTNAVAPMTVLIYRVNPGVADYHLAPAQSMKTPDISFNPLAQNGFGTTEANLIGYAQNLNTNGLLSASTPQKIMIPLGWQAAARDANGNLSADATRYPDGLANTVAYIRTNGTANSLKVGIQTAFGPTQNGFIGLGGPNGDNQYMAQDFSNFFAQIKPDFLEISYPDNTGARGRNAILSLYDGLAQSTWQNISGSSIPIFTRGFDTNTTPVSPNGVNEFTVQGAVDTATQLTGWVSLIKLLGYFNQYQSSAGGGVWQSFPVQPVTWGPGYAIAGMSMGGSLWFSIPHGQSIYGYLETNKFFKRIVYDPLVIPGHQIISNSTYSVWTRDLSGGEKLVSIFNPSTNASVTVTLQGSDVGFAPGVPLTYTDIILDTNAPSVTTISTTVTNLSAAGFLVKPVAISTSAAMSAALATLGSTVGSVLYVGTDQTYHTLTPGSAGQALQTLGAGVAPIWGDVTNGIATNVVWTAASPTVGVNTNGQVVSPYVATNSIGSNLLSAATWTAIQNVTNGFETTATVNAKTNLLETIVAAQALTNSFDTTAAVNGKTNTVATDMRTERLASTNQLAIATTNIFESQASAAARTNTLGTDLRAERLASTNQLAIATTNIFESQASAAARTNTLGTDLRAERLASTNQLNTALVAKILQATNDLAAATTNQFQAKIGQGGADGWGAFRSNNAFVQSRDAWNLTNMNGGQIQLGTITSNSIAGSTIGTNKVDASFYAFLTSIASGSSPSFGQILSGVATLVGFQIGNSATLFPTGTGLVYANRVIGDQTNRTTGPAFSATWATNIPNGGAIGGLLITTNGNGTRIGTTAGMFVNDVGSGYNVMAAPLTNTAWTVTPLGDGSSGTNLYLAGTTTIENPFFTGAFALSTISATTLTAGGVSVTNLNATNILASSITLATGVTNNSLTASRVVVSDANKAMSSLAAVGDGWLLSSTSSIPRYTRNLGAGTNASASTLEIGATINPANGASLTNLTALFATGGGSPLTNSFNSTNNTSHYGILETNDTTHNWSVTTNGGEFATNAVTGAWFLRTNDSITLSNLQGFYLTYTNGALTLTNRTGANLGSRLTSTNIVFNTGAAGSNTLYDADGTTPITVLTNGGGWFLNYVAAPNFIFTQSYPRTNNFPAVVGAVNLYWHAGNQYIITNASLTIAGFVNSTASNGVENKVMVSISNSSASSITFTWPAGVRNFGTNTATSCPISAGKVGKFTFVYDNFGTNLMLPQMQNN